MRKHAAGRGGVEPGERGWVNSVFSLSRFIAMIVKEARRGFFPFFSYARDRAKSATFFLGDGDRITRTSDHAL